MHSCFPLTQAGKTSVTFHLPLCCVIDNQTCPGGGGCWGDKGEPTGWWAFLQPMSGLAPWKPNMPGDQWRVPGECWDHVLAGGLCQMGFSGGSVAKESACNAGDWGSTRGFGRSLEKGMAIHSSILAWRIPWTEEPGELQSMGLQRGVQSIGLQRVRHD